MRNVLREQIKRALHIDRIETRQSLAEKSGVNIHQIDAILSRDAAKQRPLHANEALSLAFVLGDRTVQALMALIGYAATSLDDAEAHGPAIVAVEMMENVARFARCAADNRIDHIEEPITTEAADNVINLALPYSSRKVPA
jgi:hypothetical protein